MIYTSRCELCRNSKRVFSKIEVSELTGSKVKVEYVECIEYGIRKARPFKSQPRGEGCFKYDSKAPTYILDMEDYTWKLKK